MSKPPPPPTQCNGSQCLDDSNSSNNSMPKHHQYVAIPLEEQDAKDSAKSCPVASASFFSRLTFWWFNGLVRTGYRKPLRLDDVWQLEPEYAASAAVAQFDRACQSQTTTGNIDIVKGVFRAFGWPFATGVVVLIVHDLIQLIGPQLLKLLMDFISSTDGTMPYGLTLAAMFFLMSSLESITSATYQYIHSCVAMRIRAALFSAIYRKSLHLSNSSRKTSSTGEMVNLMAVDVHSTCQFLYLIPSLLTDPIKIIAILCFLWAELGPSVLAGLGVMCAMLVFNHQASSWFRSIMIEQMKAKDKRATLINELLSAMRVIKLYGWEIPFLNRVNEVREQELKNIRKVGWSHTVLVTGSAVFIFLVTFVTFALYAYVSDENVLNAKKIFVCLSLFALLKQPLIFLPQVITTAKMLYVNIKRVERFLNLPHLDNYVEREASSEAINIEKGCFTWDAPNDRPILTDINLDVKKGSLVAVVGNVGSGKSSLLSAILGDMTKSQGRVNISPFETIGYVPQQAWICNTSLRENILFGEDYVKARYESIVEACALTPDFEVLPAGDMTEIGEKGINLSGGQKQRVAIARACYSNASLLLLDDPLSAVDSHVAQHIFHHVISSKSGYLRDKTRILVTNNIAFLPQVDRIIVLENGSITESGTYNQLMTSSGKFADFVREHANENVTHQEDYSSSSVELKKSQVVVKKSDDSKGQLIQEEETEKGKVKLSVYLTYFRSLTWHWFTIMLICYVVAQLVTMSQSIWFAEWPSDEDQTQTRDRLFLVYGLLGLVQGVIAAAAFITKVFGTNSSSLVLHQRMLNQIVRSPMRFFETTPVGRIVTRFSTEMHDVDTELPHYIRMVFPPILEVTATVLLIVYEVPIFIVPIVPIFMLYNFIQKYYIGTSRQLTRLESVTRSPIYSHFSETLAGVESIRAYGAVNRFIVASSDKLNTNHRCHFLSFVATRWLSIRLEFCGNLIVFFAAVFVVLYRDSFADRPGWIGLIITYAMGMTNTLNTMVSKWSGFESALISVERINQYCNNESEREWVRKHNENPQIPFNWPDKGEIQFLEYSMRYREGLDLVLDRLNLHVYPGEKIGIVGRTGAGKSSMTLALLRILEAAEGKIVIDGIDIGRIGLHELRSKLSIIPQDPILFSGTLRFNLDPLCVHSDEALYDVLQHCHMRKHIESTGQGLDFEVAENGSNLSVGQRQLICLGRALLRRTKILILDEATAAMDLETDALIQQTIRQEFANCTVLTIAHRLNTIMDSSRVLVLEGGKVIEFDSPQNLLANINSHFYSFAKDARLV